MPPFLTAIIEDNGGFFKGLDQLKKTKIILEARENNGNDDY